MVETTPQWQKDADKLKKKLDGTLYVQVAYFSDQDHPCKPILLSFSMTSNQMPIVVDAPVGLQNPIYDWVHQKWQERDTSALSEQLTNLKNDIKNLKEDANTTKESLKNNKELVQEVTNLQKGQANITTVLGQLLPAVQELSSFAKTIQVTNQNVAPTTPKEGE